MLLDCSLSLPGTSGHCKGPGFCPWLQTWLSHYISYNMLLNSSGFSKYFQVESKFPRVTGLSDISALVKTLFYLQHVSSRVLYKNSFRISNINLTPPESFHQQKKSLPHASWRADCSSHLKAFQSLCDSRGPRHL